MPKKALATTTALVLMMLTATCSKNEPSVSPDRGPKQPTTKKAPSPRVIADSVPRLRMRISGFMEGRLTPCGCASGMLGGLPRRLFELKADRSYDLLIEGGQIIKDTTEFDHFKLNTALEILKLAGYQVVGLGSEDLKNPPTELLGEFLAEAGVPLVASDIEWTDKPAGYRWEPLTFSEQKLKPVTVRTASLVRTLPLEGLGKHFKLLTAADAWKRAMRGVAATTYRILLAHGDRQGLDELGKLQPKPDLIVFVSKEYHEPPSQPSSLGGIPLVYTGIRGRLLVDATLARDENGPILTRYKTITLTGSDTVKNALDDKEATQLMMNFRDLVAQMGHREQLANRFATRDGATFVGSKACAECHKKDYEAWKRSKHADAWKTLERAEKDPKRYGWPVTQFPDCVKCHTVGYYQKSGFMNPKETPDLRGVGCEECHGPASRHVAAPNDRTITLGSITPDGCTKCHDFEQSPDFDYLKRWKIIEHGKK